MSTFPQQPFYSANIVTTSNTSNIGETWYPTVGQTPQPVLTSYPPTFPLNAQAVFLSPSVVHTPEGYQDIALRLDVVMKLQRWLVNEGCLNFSDAIEALFFELEHIADLLERLHQDSTPL